MKKLIILLLLFLLLLSGFVFSERIKTFGDLLKPHQITVDKSQLYIAEGPAILIYSLEDLRFITKFGKAGEGPQEFKIQGNGRITLDVSSGYIMVNSTGRVSLFSKEGIFFKEITAAFGRDFIPMGEHFVGVHYVQRKNRPDKMKAVKTYDSNLKEIKEIYRMKGRYERGKGYRMFSEPHSYRVYQDKIFVGGYEDFTIDVLDKNGEKRFSIKQDYEREKVGEMDKQAVIHYIDTSPRYNETRDFFKRVLIFPTYFPAIRDFFVTDGNVYVLTYKKVEENFQLFVFDLQGNPVKKTFIPIVEDNLFVEVNPFVIGNGKLYQLIENEDEEWELHIHEI